MRTIEALNPSCAWLALSAAVGLRSLAVEHLAEEN